MISADVLHPPRRLFKGRLLRLLGRIPACQKAQTFAYEPHIGNVVAVARRYTLARTRRGKTRMASQ